MEGCKKNLESFSGEEDLTESSGGYPLSTNSSGGHPLFILDDVQLIWRLMVGGKSFHPVP